MRTPDITPKMRGKFKRMAIKWLKGATELYPIDDAIQDGICAALDHVNPKPANVTWEQHMVFHIIKGIRLFNYEQQVLTKPQHVHFDWVTSIQQPEPNDDDVQEQRGLRDEQVRTVMRAMKPASRQLLIETVIDKVSPKILVKQYNIHRNSLYYRRDQVKTEFKNIARQLGYLDDSGQAIDSRSVITESMSLLQCPHPKDEFHGWYRTDCTSQTGVFQSESGEEIVLSDQQAELKARCERLRSQRSHSADVWYSKVSRHRIDSQSSIDHPPVTRSHQPDQECTKNPDTT